MSLPPLYKFLDVQGAKLTLGNGTFKHAKPSDFNDTEDLTIQSIFPETTEEALKKLSSTGSIDVIVKHINDPPTCSSPLREKVALLQQALRANPDEAEAIKAEIAKEDHTAIYDVDRMRAIAIAFHKDINEFMQGWRILCVTTHNNSEMMWTRYAENHKGVVVRIVPNTAKDSKFKAFRPVVYRAARPSLYDDTLKFLEDSLFVNLEERLKVMFDKIIYSKTLDWEDEGEFRLAIPVKEGEKPWNTQPYHPDEITEIYLGMLMDDADKTDILAKAKALNPKIVVLQAKRNEKNEIVFDELGCTETG